MIFSRISRQSFGSLQVDVEVTAAAGADGSIGQVQRQQGRGGATGEDIDCIIYRIILTHLTMCDKYLETSCSCQSKYCRVVDHQEPSFRI